MQVLHPCKAAVALPYMADMRLSDRQCSVIRCAVTEYFGQDACVWLFGSRVDDAARGGDIDLYIEPAIGNADEIVQARLRFLVALHKKLGEQKIDVVIRLPGCTVDLPVYTIAKHTGVPL